MSRRTAAVRDLTSFVDAIIKTSAIRDRNITTPVIVHGNALFRNGWLAKFSFALTFINES
jgi:hypothetical protein